LRGYDYGVIEHAHIARTKDAGQVAHGEILKAPRTGNKHSRRITRTRGAQGDQVGREIEIEEVDAHRGPLPRLESVRRRGHCVAQVEWYVEAHRLGRGRRRELLRLPVSCDRRLHDVRRISWRLS